MPESISFTLRHTEATAPCLKRRRQEAAGARADTEAPIRLHTAVIPEGVIPVRAEGSDKNGRGKYAYA